MIKSEREPRETYDAGASFSDEGALHHQMDVYRNAAMRYRVGAFWCAIIPGLFTAYAWAESEMATGKDWLFAWQPFALIVLLPIPSLLIARHYERMTDQFDLWGHMGLKRRQAGPPADPPADPPAPPPTV